MPIATIFAGTDTARRTSVFACALTAAVLQLSGCAKTPPPPPPVEVAIIQMQPRAATVTEDFVAQTEARDAIEIRPRVGGLLEKQTAVDGERVHRGQLLFTIDAQPYIAALAQAMHGWTNASLPDPPQVAVVLDGIVAASRAARTVTPRADDLAGQAASVQGALARLQITVAQATGRRDQASAALESAIADVQTVNADAP